VTSKTPCPLGDGQVYLVDFSIAAERTADQRQLCLEEDNAFIELANYFLASLFFPESSMNQLSRDAAGAFVGNRCKASFRHLRLRPR